MRHSTQAGLSGAARDDPARVARPGSFRLRCDGGAVAFPALFTVGVGHVAGVFTAAPSDHPCSPASCDGVALNCRFSFGLARGVGHADSNDEDSGASVRGADVGGGDVGNTGPVSGLTKPGKHNVEPSRAERRDVFRDDDAGAELVDDSEVFEPEPGPGPGEAGASSSGGNVLTGESATEHLAGREVVRPHRPDVVKLPCLRPVHREHATGPGVLLDVEHRATEARTLEAQLEPADPRKERPDAPAHDRASPHGAVGNAGKGPGPVRAGRTSPHRSHASDHATTNGGQSRRRGVSTDRSTQACSVAMPLTAAPSPRAC